MHIKYKILEKYFIFKIKSIWKEKKENSSAGVKGMKEGISN